MGKFWTPFRSRSYLTKNIKSTVISLCLDTHLVLGKVVLPNGGGWGNINTYMYVMSPTRGFRVNW